MTTPTFLAASDQEYFESPPGWDFSVYAFDPKSFWFSQTNLALSANCEIVRYDFRGRIRFRAGLKKPALQFAFIDSYSATASRLQGIPEIESVVLITLGGYDWDAISDIGALGIDINFDEAVVRQIITDETGFF
jgi:hypothetical protein